MSINDVEFIDDSQYNFDNSQLDVEEEEVQNGVLLSGDCQLFLLHDGQYLIPSEGQTFILENNDGEDLVISDKNDYVYVNNDNLDEQIPGMVEIVNDSDVNQVIYYTNEIDDDSDKNLQLMNEDDLNQQPLLKCIKLENFPELEELVQVDSNDSFNKQLQVIDNDNCQYAVIDVMEQEFIEDTSNETTKLDLSKITGRNLITGQTVTLDSYYVSKLQERANSVNEASSAATNDCQELLNSSEEISDVDNFINKKLFLGVTSSGKKLVGKILQIHKKDDETIVSTEENQQNQIDDDAVELEIEDDSSDDLQLVTTAEAEDTSTDLLQIDETEKVDSFTKLTANVFKTHESQESQIYIKKHLISRDTYEYVAKTLVGMMEMESIQGRLINKNIVIKLVEKTYSPQKGSFKKSISYFYGYMDKTIDGNNESWKFILNNDAGEDEIIVAKFADTLILTFVIAVDMLGRKSTRVTINPQLNENKCTVCGKQFKTVMHLRRHVSNTHERDRNLACTYCEKTFSNQHSLRLHKRDHSNDLCWYECPTCNKTFNTQNSLKRHLGVHDPNLRPLECTLCLQRFTDQSSLKKHLLIHTGIKAYQCSLCSRSFINQGDLNFHMRIHDPLKQFTCTVCGRQFSRHANLQRHVEIHQGSGAMYRCDVCGCSYNYISSLTRHIVQNHLNKE